MIHYFSTFFNIQFSSNYNKIVYTMQKLPILGRVVSDKWYKSNELKSSLSILSFVLFILNNLIKKVMFFGFFLLVSLFIPFIWQNVTLSTQEIFVTLLLLNILFGGTVLKSLFIDIVSEIDIISIKFFSIPPKIYYQIKLIYDYVCYFIFNSLVLAGFFYFLQLPIFQAFIFLISIICIRTFTTSVSIHFYKWGLNPNKEIWTWITIILSVTSWIASLALSYFNYPLSLNGITEGWFVLVIVVLFVTGVIGWKNSDELNPIAFRLLSFETLRTHQKDLENVESASVSMKETDYKELEDEDVVKKQEGIAYLNEIFFQRTRHHLFNHIRRRVVLSALVSIGLVVLFFFTGEAFSDSYTFFYTIGFISFIASNYLYYGEEFSKFCFYNLDRKLMKYRFYRKPDIVMESIKIRFIKALKLNLPVLLLFMVTTLLFYIFSDGVSVAALLLSFGLQLLLMIFFSLNYLILYYLIQPYTESMKTKSPVYSTINGLFLFFFFSVLYVENEMLPIIIPIITVFMILYLPIGLFTVYKIAPKQFKLRY